jgi:hypothetical protein
MQPQRQPTWARAVTDRPAWLGPARILAASALVALAAGCAPADPEAAGGAESVARAAQALRPVPGAEDHLVLVPEPGPPPHEAPRRSTLWQRATPAGADPAASLWRPAATVLDVARAGRARLVPDGRLLLDGAPVQLDGAPLAVHPPLAEAADGRLAFAAGLAPETDLYVWHPAADGAPARLERRTTDGQSDRPFWLPDGRLLWVSGAGGLAGFVLEGERLSNRGGAEVAPAARTPVPAAPRHTRAEGDTVRFDAGDGWYRLELSTGAVRPEVSSPEPADPALADPVGTAQPADRAVKP